MTVGRKLKRLTLLALCISGVLLVFYGVVAAWFFDAPISPPSKWSHEKDFVGLHIVIGLMLAAWAWFELKLLPKDGEPTKTSEHEKKAG